MPSPQGPCRCYCFLNTMLRGCPGFGWDKIHFLLSSWHSAVFRAQGENNVENTLLFWLLLICAYPKPRTFQSLKLCQ